MGKPIFECSRCYGSGYRMGGVECGACLGKGYVSLLKKIEQMDSDLREMKDNIDIILAIVEQINRR